MAVRTAKRKRNFIVQGWEMLPVTGKLAVTGAGAFGIYSLYNSYKKNKADKDAKKALDKLSKEFNQPFVVSSGKDQGVIMHIDLAKTATSLHDDLHAGIFGTSPNRNEIKSTLLRVPKPYMESLEYIYKRVYDGANLESEVKKALNIFPYVWGWDEVKYLFQ